MIAISATTQRRIWGTTNAWSTEQFAEQQPNTIVEIALEIVGDDDSGFNLIASPRGYRMGDLWYQTLADAKHAAQEEFGVATTAWNEH